MTRFILLPALAVLALASACSSGGPTPTGTAPAQEATAPDPAPKGDLISQAEAAVKNELPDIPLWKGATFKGVKVNDSTICVDRTYRPGGGIDNKGGSAGYVIATFPGPTLSEAQDGTCGTAKATSSAPAIPVQVPDDAQSRPGLVTKTDLGDKWPLTVEYGFLSCTNKEAGGMALELAVFTAPDGTEYALNGSAKAHTDAQDIEPIWANSPNSPGTRVDIGPLLQRTRALC